MTPVFSVVVEEGKRKQTVSHIRNLLEQHVDLKEIEFGRRQQQYRFGAVPESDFVRCRQVCRFDFIG